MKPEEIINGLYVELDCLIDTRLSLLYDIDKDLIAGLIKDGTYHSRYRDTFGYIGSNLFNYLYKNRNSNILDNPSPTEINTFVADYCFEANQTAKGYGSNKEVTVYLNLYPYNLSEENKELLIMGLINSVGTKINVELINKPYTEITPSFVSKNIGLMVMYNGLSWIEYFTQNNMLQTISLPDVILATPMLIKNRLIIDEKELDRFFKDISKNIEPLIGLVFLPTNMFSIIVK